MRARDNPFATERVLRLRYQFPTADSWPVLMARLASLNYRAAIVGPLGSGKTTLLEDLGGRLQNRGFRIHSIFLNDQDNAYPLKFMRTVARRLTSNDIILLDGCEQLNLFNWLRFRWDTRRAGGLIVTTHHPSRLPQLWQCETNPELLNNLIHQLLNRTASITSASEIRRLYKSHDGNLREALRELYDIASRQSDTLTCIRQQAASTQ